MVEFQQNVIFPAIFLHAECSSTIPCLSKSAAAIRTCGEHPNGITINYVTVSSICNRARCVIGSRRAAVGGRARRRTQLWRTFESVQKVILHTYCKVASKNFKFYTFVFEKCFKRLIFPTYLCSKDFQVRQHLWVQWTWQFTCLMCRDGDISWTLFFKMSNFLWTLSKGDQRVTSRRHFWWLLVDTFVHEKSSFCLNFRGHFLGEF